MIPVWTENLALVIGTVLTTWVVQNTKLKEGVTDWFVGKVNSGNANTTTHSVLENIKRLQYESQLQEFDNSLKEELYKFYCNVTLNTFSEIVNDYIEMSKIKKLLDLKKSTKIMIYDKLQALRNNIDSTVELPEVLQIKFDRFRNYIEKQYIDILEKALNASNKTLLNIYILDAIDNNSNWFVFYTIDMFENFNGQFDSMDRSDIFRN